MSWLFKPRSISLSCSLPESESRESNRKRKDAPSHSHSAQSQESEAEDFRQEPADVSPRRTRVRLSPQPGHAAVGLRRLNDSSFGLFLKVIQDLSRDGKLDDLGMPKIVVAGMVSAGKSTLMEIITQSPIFPRQASDCTKNPVVVKLRRTSDASLNRVTIQHKSLGAQAIAVAKDEVCAMLQSIMNLSPPNTVQKDEIVIELHQEDVPTLDLVDLPGVRASPPAAAETSKAMLKEYLADFGTMVLLVVPATESSLVNDAAMEVVRSAGKQSRTILALTKCDDVNPVMVEELLLQRILRTAVDMQDQDKFFGCVGVINRTHKDTVTLDQAAAQEPASFEAKLSTAWASLSADERSHIQANITVTQLVKRIDEMFHADIVQYWKPWALEQLEPKVAAADDELKKLGPSVEQLSANQVLQGLIDLVDFDRLNEAILDEPICLQPPAAGWSHECFESNPRPMLSQLSSFLNYFSGSATAFDNLTRLEAHKQAAAAITTALEGPAGKLQSAQFLVQAVVPAIAAAFGRNSSLKLKRFSSLESKLCTDIVPAVFMEAVSGCWPEIQQALLHARGEQCTTSTRSGGQPYRNLATKVVNLLAQELILRLADTADFEAKAGPAEAWLREDEAAVQKRQSVEAKRQGILDARETIKTIDSMIKK